MAELRPSGFPEYSPSQQLIFDQLKSSIENSYQQFWYTHIQTPAVERNSVLLSKNGEETGKQIFGLYGIAQWADDLKDYALHFDLTVPFARYTLDRENQLTFPFKRYQIQPVWRGERAQKGRFREFVQCDIDVIWKEGKNYLYYDAEIIATLGNTLSSIIKSAELEEGTIFRINHKKVINSFLDDITQDPLISKKISSLIDKYSKIGKENFLESLDKDLGIDAPTREKILNFITFETQDIKKLEELKTHCSSESFWEGVAELQEVIMILEQLREKLKLDFAWKVDMQIVRGLDYYTGTIFEANFINDPKIGSICGGGRYDNLTRYIDEKRASYCGVGGSIGISRILDKIFDQEKKRKATIADYLFINFEENFEHILSLARDFFARGERAEIYPEADKLGKQFGYADKKGIPFVVVYGKGEREQNIYKIKNMNTGEETQHTIQS